MSPLPDAEALLLRLEWTVIRRLDGLLHGDYRSFFRGPGLDLADLREYQHHDDVRHIDWNVTARMQTPHVREYNEDRDLTAWFLLDLSASLDFGTRIKKQAVSAEFVGVLARLLTRHGNRIGALCYGSQVDTVIPARSGRLQVLHLLRVLLARPVTRPAPTQLAALLAHAARILPRRALVFVVSDFISTPGWERVLGRLAMRHEVIAVRLSDPLEHELPDIGMLLLEDPESGEQLFVDTHDKSFRHRFAGLAAEREAALRTAFAEAGVDALELSTEGDLMDALLRFADLRALRSRMSGSGVPSHLVSAAGAKEGRR
ncbi:MAG: DUF58 domain-containing protein [Candidatus Dactylopiibacterium carminicum]|uniref:DUF58 domain-containing protein n=1 Tax=Candidatus Dactylopiibacterium carminicum TaxID=857335 RepID=A0A272EWB8_9RHOO|nr:DUF58 domain-containing protein [Candidatus Dactylopiibacterium carminicum]KAF7599566.1 DUF58 domain-containing protein [Candidatus Dactylopiibacterium carminicum]PAS94408.1 MAG: DUF58 domain-containing protein [Candidatus Dactylopiibacterium carminicum]PAS96429.1 MAG: DUF58 domain-containing protein [Candidatus Dactylopiibacterium carminicum]PAS99569.1 MAG: ATPase [Candidatus Dactylopiibacterium carminicum]